MSIDQMKARSRQATKELLEARRTVIRLEEEIKSLHKRVSKESALRRTDRERVR